MREYNAHPESGVDGDGTVLVVMGTRPEAIKLAPVVAALRAQERLRSVIVATSQHRELLQQALSPFGLVADEDLQVMTEGQTPAQVASAVIARLEPLLGKLRPRWTVVQGDTASAFAAAVAAFYAQVPVAHVEAGLRSGRLDAPFPEEFNRRGVAVAATLHCAPTPRAAENLRREGVSETAIAMVGNTVVDAVRFILGKVGGRPAVKEGKPQILVTLHRRESFGTPLERVLRALRQLAEERAGKLRLIYPVHPNPNISGPARRLLHGVPGVELVPPLDYPELLRTFAASRFAVSDSGGIQEEAPSVGVPVLVVREVTERPEVVEAGWAKLVGTDAERLLAEARRLLEDDAARAAMTAGPNPFGDGHAGERIATLLAQRPE